MAGTLGNRRPLAWPAARLALFAFVLTACSASGGVAGSSLRAEERGREPLEARVWRAGRAIPPGLSAARVAELEQVRERAIEVLGRELTRADSARLAAWLAASGTDDELWSAAAGTVAALGRYELAELLGAALEAGAAPRRCVAAREALHRLYGRWFTSLEELDPYLRSVSASPGTRLLLESSAWEESRSRERLLAGLAGDPPRAAAWLADPDPRVRSGAARILSQVFRREGGDASATLELLIAHLEGEHEPQAFQDGLLACMESLERSDVDQPLCARFCALLFEVARSPADPRTTSAAAVLARIPWRKAGPRDLGHVLSGIDALGAMLRGQVEADRLRGVNDPDPLVSVLAALRELCEQAGAAGLAEDLRATSVRESVFAVLRDPAQDEATRSAAAASLGLLARVSDGPVLAAVLSDSAVTPSVKHALLGALRSILTLPESPEGRSSELIEAVAALTGASDSDLRRRALSLCADERLEPLVRRLDPSFLIARLEHEESAPATLELLRLIQRFARPDMLGALLALGRFDRLAADPATLDELFVALEKLARRSGRDAMNAAVRLDAVPSEATSLTRLRYALSLVSALDDAAAFELDPREHRAVASWVWRIYQAGVAPRDCVTQGLGFEQRVLDVHLPRGEQAGAGAGGGLGPFEEAHLTALLRADLLLWGVGRGSKPQVEAAFESAHQLASTRALEYLVLRDRARFRAAANECVKALSDYRRLFEAGQASDGLLGIPDLRSAVELLGRLDEAGGTGNSATSGEACDLLLRILARPAWRAEPASVRMQDLRALVRSGLDSRDRVRVARIEAELADLPLTQIETQLERDPPPVWFGLTREAAWFQELLDLRARLRLGLRKLEAPG